MNKTRKILLLVLLSLLLISFSISAIEIGTSFVIGNLSFPKTRVSTDTGFTGLDFPWGINLFLNQSLSDTFFLKTGFYMDPILRNIYYTNFFYQQNFFSIGVGPFFGLFNSSSSILNSGLSSTVRLEWPGVLFIALRADSSIGGRIVQTGDYLQERNDIGFGFYVRNAICSINLITKQYTGKTDAGTVIDSTEKYFFEADIYQKNIPYKLLLTFGYEKLLKTFVEEATVAHGLGSLMVGVNFKVAVRDFLSIFIDLDSSVYSFGTDELLGIANPGPGGYLFKASTGFSINLDSI